LANLAELLLIRKLLIKANEGNVMVQTEDEKKGYSLRIAFYKLVVIGGLEDLPTAVVLVVLAQSRGWTPLTIISWGFALVMLCVKGVRFGLAKGKCLKANGLPLNYKPKFIERWYVRLGLMFTFLGACLAGGMLAAFQPTEDVTFLAPVEAAMTCGTPDSPCDGQTFSPTPVPTPVPETAMLGIFNAGGFASGTTYTYYMVPMIGYDLSSYVDGAQVLETCTESGLETPCFDKNHVDDDCTLEGRAIIIASGSDIWGSENIREDMNVGCKDSFPCPKIRFGNAYTPGDESGYNVCGHDGDEYCLYGDKGVEGVSGRSSWKHDVQQYALCMEKLSFTVDVDDGEDGAAEETTEANR